jgi:hypothetical protein
MGATPPFFPERSSLALAPLRVRPPAIMLLVLTAPYPDAMFASLTLTKSVVLPLTDVLLLRVPCMVERRVRYVQFKVVQFEPILEAGEEGFGSVLVHFQKCQGGVSDPAICCWRNGSYDITPVS